MKTLIIITTVIFFNTVTAAAQTQSLFNGKDFNGWHADVPAMDNDKLVKSPFVIREGNIVILASPQGHLFTNTVYQDYRLQVEYRFTATPGNCGVIVHASAPRIMDKMYPKSIEVQLEHNNAGDLWCIGENIDAPDMENRHGPAGKDPGTVSSFVKTIKKWMGISEGRQNRIIKLTGNSEKPPGEWNTMVIECVGSYIKVWLNGNLVNYGFNCTANKGQVALQAEGSEVAFRKVELSPISKLTE